MWHKTCHLPVSILLLVMSSPLLSQPTQSEDASATAKINQQLADQAKASEFELQLGLGSLVRNGQITDYTNNANTLSATSLGDATPQYLLGVSMRSPIANFPHIGPDRVDCLDKSDPTTAGSTVRERTTVKARTSSSVLPVSRCQWQLNPWSGFVSLKFSSGASQTLNGYVFGVSYGLLHYLNVLVGYSLTPVQETSHGLRNAAAIYVTQQQKQGLLLSFSPTAMQNNLANAFDGFSLVDANNKLIYTGTPLETHYHGGAVIGISIPISFADFLKGK